MAEEHILEDVSDSQEGYFDIYVRFNDDNEKDYCFQRKASDTFSSLFEIFNKLPIALRPSIFYSTKPVGFKVSEAPGYLTEDGALLFDYSASKQSRIVANSDLILANTWPGQLILPNWEFNYFRHYSVILLLLTWLYTDLPDSLSPTPKIGLSTHIIHLIVKGLIYFKKYDLAANLLAEALGPISHTTEAVFFVFHIVKVTIIYLTLASGLFNPYKLFASNTKLNISRDDLIKLGWTGTRKASPDEYKDFYRDYKIKELGGMIKAHQAGLFDILINLGSFMKLGEGFSTPIDNKATIKDLENSNTFSLNYEYITLLSSYFAEFVQEKEGQELSDFIKQFRRYGLLHSNEKIQALVQKRKSLNKKVEEPKLKL